MSEAQANADRYEHSFAVMAVDLDRFKEVNDTYGHEAGDLLLCLFVERLKAQLRKGDLLARMGGDEFVLLLPEVKGEADVEPVAAKIVESLSGNRRALDDDGIAAPLITFIVLTRLLYLILSLGIKFTLCNVYSLLPLLQSLV